MNILQQATCVGVVPGMIKGAFVFGAQYGQGVVTCRTGHGWSAPVFIRMAGGSWGLQIGGQATDLVLVAVNDRGFQDLLKSKFKIGGDASAAAGPVGRNSQAATDWKMNAELLTYSRNKGLFAGISLDGTGVCQNKEDTEIYLRRIRSSFRMYLKGNVGVPAGRRRVRSQAVAHYFAEAKNELSKRCALTHTVVRRPQRRPPPFFCVLRPDADVRHASTECLNLCFVLKHAGDGSSIGWLLAVARVPLGDAALAGASARRVLALELSYPGPGPPAPRGRAKSALALPDLPAIERSRILRGLSIATSAGNWSSSAACRATRARIRALDSNRRPGALSRGGGTRARACWCSPGISAPGSFPASTTR